VAVILDGIAAPKTTWDSPLEAFKDALDHEKQVTKNFLDLMDLAISLKDHASQIFLQWFVTEQVEEEKSTGDVVAMLEKIRGSVGAVFQLDRQLGKREDD
jgi:ferritin